MKSGFMEKLIERLDRIDAGSLQTHFLRLAREKGLMETILDAVHEGLIVLDDGGLIRYANRASQQLLGFTLEQAVGVPVERYLHEIDWDRILALDEGEWSRLVSREIETTYPRHRFIEFYVVPLSAVRAEEQGAVVMLRDVTREREDGERHIESERLQAITLLAAGVAHEIGNPLNSLTIHLQLMERALRKADAPKEQIDPIMELLAVSREEITRLDRIINRFLHAVRPSAPQLEPLRMETALQAILDFMKGEIEDRGVWVEMEKPDSLPLVEADPAQVQQVFFNVIRNALQAMAGGGLLRVVLGSNDRFLTVALCDTGPGIAPEELGHLFEPYHTTKEEGSGLGLMIVQRIMRDHGGEIEVESAPDRGATIRLFFPRADRKTRLLRAHRPGAAAEPGADATKETP